MLVKKIIILLTILLTTSCDDPYTTYISTFNLENKCGVELSIVLYDKINDTISIPNNETHVMVKKFYGSTAYPFDCDSIGIIFDDSNEMIYTYYINSSRNPLLIDKYTKIETGKNSFEFTYTFIKDDLNIE